ncbi:MAG: LysR family transcriptional regulator [Bifidobacterium sp.]|uniref:LysR family transcriptional regulator n=1 Tax=Bifidobacterium fermentum TaxID=3059035 RepID=A0AB39UKW8_9BIFI
MEVEYLRTLRELRDRGSVTAVAKARHLSPSAVSQQLAALQRTVNVPLTRQSGRVLVLTDTGERLADASEAVFASLSIARDSVDHYLQAMNQIVTVTAFHSAGLAWFPPLIGYSLSHPGGPQVHCRDEDVAVEEFVPLVADYNVVIAHRPLDSAPWPKQRVHISPILTEPIDLALSRDHPLAQHPTVKLEDIAHETWIAAHEGFALEPLLLQAMATTAGGAITIAHRVNEFNVAAAIIATTHIVGLLPRYTGLPPQFRDRVVLRPIEHLTIARHIDALSRPDVYARASVKSTIASIRQIAKRAVGQNEG